MIQETSADIKKYIQKLEQERAAKVQEINVEYRNRMDAARAKLQRAEQQEFVHRVECLAEVNIDSEFNEWWRTWLKLYDKVYRDTSGNYCWVDVLENSVHEIHILSAFKEGDINQLSYYKNMEYGLDRRVVYCYIHAQTGDKYVYQDRKWQKCAEEQFDR